MLVDETINSYLPQPGFEPSLSYSAPMKINCAIIKTKKLKEIFIIIKPIPITYLLQEILQKKCMINTTNLEGDSLTEKYVRELRIDYFTHLKHRKRDKLAMISRLQKN